MKKASNVKRGTDSDVKSNSALDLNPAVGSSGAPAESNKGSDQVPDSNAGSDSLNSGEKKDGLSIALDKENVNQDTIFFFSGSSDESESSNHDSKDSKIEKERSITGAEEPGPSNESKRSKEYNPKSPVSNETPNETQQEPKVQKENTDELKKGSSQEANRYQTPNAETKHTEATNQGEENFT